MYAERKTCKCKTSQIRIDGCESTEIKYNLLLEEQGITLAIRVKNKIVSFCIETEIY